MFCSKFLKGLTSYLISRSKQHPPYISSIPDVTLEKLSTLKDYINGTAIMFVYLSNYFQVLSVSMDHRRLSEAAQTGDVQKLHQLVGENPLILHTHVLASAGNLLHVASAYGHVEFVKEIINLRPELAQEFNQDGFSPMHIASSIGHTEVVRELLKVDHQLCHLQGPENMTPLHFAAVKGKVHVLSEMISACPECIQDVTIQGDTALHLAIKNNQFAAIRVVVNWVRDMKKEDMFNMKDEQGNTVLHLAAWKKQRQVIDLLLGQTAANVSGGVEVNAINKSGLTALDLLQIFPSEAGDREIEEILRSSGAERKTDVTLSHSPSLQPNHQTSVSSPATAETTQRRTNDLMEYFKFKKGRDSPGETRSALLLVAALVATTSFQFGVNPPGGVWQDNYMPDKNSSSEAHNAGKSIWGSTNTLAFALFMCLNSLGFKMSIYMITILTTKFPLQFELQVCFFAMYFTYDTAVITTAPAGIQIFIIVIEAIVPVLIPLTAIWARECRKKLIERRTNP